MRTVGSKVAFVLSGGASLGAVQVGMLRALVDEGVRPDLIVGTSVGAVNGAFLASCEPGAEAVEELAAIWRSVRRGQVFPVEPLTGFLGFIGARKNLVPAGALLLSEGPLVDAVLASAAIPGVLPPVDWHGRLLVDGGVVNNTPISHALDLGATEVWVLPTGAPCDLTKAPRGALGMVVQATSLMVAHRFAADAAALGARADVRILPPPCPIDVQPMDFGHADDLMLRAESDARAFLAGRRRRLVPLSAA
jgi:NTE family protein